jgi:hypothetical protein
MTIGEWLGRYKKRFMEWLPDEVLAQALAEASFTACRDNPNDYEGCEPENIADDDMRELSVSLKLKGSNLNVRPDDETKLSHERKQQCRAQNKSDNASN